MYIHVLSCIKANLPEGFHILLQLLRTQNPKKEKMKIPCCTCIYEYNYNG